MPKETTPFRIDFEGIAWSSTQDTIPPTFDPDTFTPIDLDEVPKTFDLQCSGNMAITDLYKSLALQQVFLDGNSVQGTLFNFGIQEVTVPQLITSYYKKDEGLVWVDHHFVLDGVRIQRKQRFTYDLADTNRLEVIYSGLENCYVNGIPNNEIVNKYTHDTTNEYSSLGAIYLNDGTTDYIRIDLNPFIGNPK